jgi:2-polyprenyl-3-methyl-5-hydroxy-6-metoxy-1,4-benzoquinol methylase
MTNISSHSSLLNYCPSCGHESISCLSPAETRKISLTDGDEMNVTLGTFGCDSCGVLFLNPRLSSNALNFYYTHQSRIPRTSLESNSPFSVLMDIQIDFINKTKSLSCIDSMLEIGCAEGYFLKKISDFNSKQKKLHAVELSKNYIQQAKLNIPNCKFYDSKFEDANFDSKFDLIIMRHVLEHLNSPRDTLLKARELLSDTGIIYIEVPDTFNIKPSINNFFHHEHLSYFTKVTLNKLLNDVGLEPNSLEEFNGNPIDSGFAYPVLRVICKKNQTKNISIETDYAKNLFNRYKTNLDIYFNSLFTPLLLKIKSIQNAGHSIGIFGAGPHTMDLLQLFLPHNIKINLIFDNNPNKHNKIFYNILVVSPTHDNLLSIDFILISSAEFENEIFNQLIELNFPTEKILRIYNN